MSDEYIVVAIYHNDGSTFSYEVKRNYQYVTSCDTLWGAKLKISRLIKGAKKRPAKEAKMKARFPEYPIVYRELND